MPGDIMAIEKSFKTDVRHHYRATRQIFHSLPAIRWYYGLFVALPLVILLLFHLMGPPGVNHLMFGALPVWSLVAMILFIALVMIPLVQYFQVSQQLKTTPSAQKEQHYSFSEKGLTNQGEGYNVELGWDSVVRVTQSKDYALFFISSYYAYYLPREFFSDTEFEQIRQWFETAQSNPSLTIPK